MKPSRTDLALLVDVSGLSAKDIAKRYGVADSTVRAWLAELRAERGESRERVRNQARTERTRDEHRAVASQMLDVMLEALERMGEVAQSVSDHAKRGRLALDIRTAVIDTMALAPEVVRDEGRPELLKRVLAATASAETQPR